MKIGDRVILVSNRHGRSEDANPVYSAFKVEGIIVAFRDDMALPIKVHWQNQYNHINYYSERDLKVISDIVILDIDELFSEIQL